MAELTIRLVVDPDTGKKNVIVAYESDEDALPMEHEEEHRRLVDRLIEGGALSAAQLGAIVVERQCDDRQAAQCADRAPNGEPSAEREAAKRDQ